MGDPTVAIIAGEGVLPRMLSEALSRAGRTHIACYPHGLEVEVPAAEEFFFERSIAFIKSLQQRGIKQIVMVGKFVRPRSLNLLRFEGSTLMAAPASWRRCAMAMTPPCGPWPRSSRSTA